MSTIYTNISEHRKKAEEQLLADYPMVASLYEIMDAYFTCVMVRLKNVKIKDQNNEGYKLKLLLSFMRSNFSLSDLVNGSEHIDAYTLLRKQLELLARFTELNTKTKEELEKSKKTPNVSNVVGMQSFYGYLSNIAHSTSYMILSDIFAYEKQIERKVGLSMQPQYNEFTIDHSFAPNFYNHYYRDFGFHFVFYPQIYDFVLCGIDYDSKDLIAFASQENNKFETKINEAQDVVDSLLKGFWQYTDEKTAENLILLLKAVEEGTLRDTASIYNASVYLFKFSYIIGKEETDVLASFKTGIGKFMDVHSISPLDKQTFLMLPIERGSICDQVYDMIASEMDRKLNENQVEDQKTLETLFNTDVEQFVLQLMPNNRVSPAYAATPILHTIPEGVIAERVPSLQPPDLMNLDSMIRQRPSVLQGSLKSELVFFQSLQKELQKRKDEKTMSAFVINEYLMKDNEKLISVR